MCHFRDKLRTRRVVTARELFECRQGQRVEVAGVGTCRQQPATASGVVFITLEDETARFSLSPAPARLALAPDRFGRELA